MVTSVSTHHCGVLPAALRSGVHLCASICPFSSLSLPWGFLNSSEPSTCLVLWAYVKFQETLPCAPMWCSAWGYGDSAPLVPHGVFST